MLEKLAVITKKHTSMKQIILLAFLFLTTLAGAQPLEWKENKALLNLKLKSSEGKTVKLRNIYENAATVFVFLSPECPLSQTYTKEILALYQLQKDNKIAFIGVFPGKDLSPEKIEAFRRTYKLPFPILLDDEYALSKVLGAKITPEVFMCDPWGGVHYKGAIDDRAVSLGKLKSSASEQYLSNALEYWLMKESFWPIETTAVGCMIEIQ